MYGPPRPRNIYRPEGYENIWENNITDIMDQVISLSRYIVENVKQDDALFIQFFGAPRYYKNVMNIFSRIAALKTANGGGQTRLHFVADMAQDTDRGLTSLIANFKEDTDSGAPTITLFSPFVALQDVFYLRPNSELEGLLTYLTYSRQSVILHELMHFVTRQEFYPPVIPWTNIFGLFDGEIKDVFLADAATRGEKKWLQEKLDEETRVGHSDGMTLEETKAYGELRVLLLPQLKKGPKYACHNADSYALFAIALLGNWNNEWEIAPEMGEAAFWYKEAVKRDPFEHLPPPFDVPGDPIFQKFWGRSGRIQGVDFG
ncbi:hypothetical protein HYFRA_00003408 [Hymenoscyphus fraxineus]|uniref:Uncharacterized protein n=1 Tax=Hymenoscyphus fraxineus TaxID=746836 RepID=A0A9N9KWE1_9HELO|nr:hypothetical protein HYFRA_00003408 [Hymenoscyphus fraxineus]